MGVYRWYLIFPLIAYSALSYSATRSQVINAVPSSFLMSRSAASDDADAVCSSKPVIIDSFGPYYTRGVNYFINYKGCIYFATGVVLVPDGQDFVSANWEPLKAVPPNIPMIEAHRKSHSKPDTGDGDNSGGNIGGDSTTPTEPDNPGVTPPVKPPVKPPVEPDSTAVSQLYQQYYNCSIQLSKYPQHNVDDYDPSVDYAYNAQVRQCNAILDRLTPLIKPGSINGGSDDNHDFLTGDGSGKFYKCSRNPHSPQDYSDQGKIYPGPVLGEEIVKNREREIGFDCQIINGKNDCQWHLNFNYSVPDGKGTSVCNSVYSSYLNSGDTGGSGGSQTCPPGYQPSVSGQGCVNSSLTCEPGFHQVPGQDPGYCVSDSSGDGSDDTGSGDDSGPGLSTPSLDVPDLTLSPLWNIWPSARDFKLTLPAADCPVFNIEVFGTNYKIDTFCTLITPNIILIIRTICILTATVFSFIIVLRS